MDGAAFRELLGELTDADWRAVAEGQALLLVDDQRLALGPATAPNAILGASADEAADPAALRQACLAEAAELLHNYYLTHPLTLAGFNRQAQQLIARHGAAAFAAPAGRLPQRTLFVDGGEVIAEPADSPRHRYGVFLELPGGLAEAALEAQLGRWLARGEAYERYLGMNLCRYNC